MEYIIECAKIKTKEEMHGILKNTLSLPEWYRPNLDALHDVLTAITSDTQLIFKDWNKLPEAVKDFHFVLDDAEEENEHFYVTYQ